MGHKELSSQTTYALKQLQHNGILLCMATGRSYPSIPHFKGIEFDVFLTFNGSYVKNHKDVIRKNPLNKEDVTCIITNLKQMNRAIAISNEEILVTNGTDPDLERYFAFGNEEMMIAENFDELCNNDIYQIMCNCRKEEHDTILQGTNHVQITAWWDKAIDIISLNGGKGAAVVDVLKYYGISKEESIAFGDGRNDIEMLEAVGTGIAMGNASEEVKNSADEICKPVDEDGIYHYCLDRNFFKEI